jgi:hypothetical protein
MGEACYSQNKNLIQLFFVCDSGYCSCRLIDTIMLPACLNLLTGKVGAQQAPSTLKSTERRKAKSVTLICASAEAFASLTPSRRGKARKNLADSASVGKGGSYHKKYKVKKSTICGMD